MAPSATLAPESIPYIEQDALESRLQDRERLEAEFAAIMTVSGFGDRIVIATLAPREPELASYRRGRDRNFPATIPVPAMRRQPRVRSPPSRP
ncbi:MAG: hypothetical protein ABI238_04680 [Terrimesophilobacter sp.]